MLDLDVNETPVEGLIVPTQLHLLQRRFLPVLGSALLAAIVLATLGCSVNGAAMLVLTWGLIALTLIDAEHQILPDAIVLPLLWIGLIANQHGLFTRLDNALYGAIAGYTALWLILNGFRILTGGEGMGRGDLKTLAMLGAWSGWQSLILVVIVACTFAASYGLAARHLSGRVDPQIPFGPFLAFGGYVAILWGHAIMQAHLR